MHCLLSFFFFFFFFPLIFSVANLFFCMICDCVFLLSCLFFCVWGGLTSGRKNLDREETLFFFFFSRVIFQDILSREGKERKGGREA